MSEEFEENDSNSRTENEKEEKSISADLIRGHINTIILRSLSDSDKYGYEIIAEIEKKSHGQYSLKQPSLYSALKRLETQGFVTSYWGGTAGGGRRKYFSLTDAGRAITEQNCSEWEYSRTIIDSLISDRDFDFSNPAPSAVNMRVLKDTTTRVSSRDFNGASADDSDRVKEMESRYNELLAEKDRIAEELSESREREEYYRSELFTSAEADISEDERERYQNLIRDREEVISNLGARYEELLEKEKQETAEKERERYEEKLNEERAQFRKEQEALLEDIRRQYEELIEKENGRITEEERAHYEAIIHEREEQIESAEARYNERIQTNASLSDDERERYEALLREQKEKLEEETARFQQELEEQAALYREREKELRHQNYMNLINSPPAPESETAEFVHYTPPVTEETEQEEQQEQCGTPSRDYRSVVAQLYESSIKSSDKPVQIKDDGARALDGIDFRDIESKAAQDGIKIVTSGKTERTKQQVSASVVHKGKALFLSGLLLFFIAVIEGAIVLGVQNSYGISVAYPCILWGIGLVVLLVTGLAYANHYGEHSLRKSTPALINAIVLYVLSVILTLIVALSVNIDFRAAHDIACFIVIPVIYLFGIVIFGITYYLQIKPKK